jgi:hypothetical protein
MTMHPASRRLRSASVGRRTDCPGVSFVGSLVVGIAFVGIAFVGIIATTGCSSGYRENVIVAKEVPAVERARQMLERYAAGQPVGSDFMGFPSLKEELEKTSPQQAATLGEAFAAIEKAMLRPAEVKKIATRALADLGTTAPAR